MSCILASVVPPSPSPSSSSCVTLANVASLLIHCCHFTFFPSKAFVLYKQYIFYGTYAQIRFQCCGHCLFDNLYFYLYLCLHLCLFKYLYLYLYLSLYYCLYVWLYLYMYFVCMCICIFVCIFIFILSVFVSVFVYVFRSVFVSVFVYIIVSVFVSTLVFVFISETDLSVATFCCRFLTFHLHCPSSCEPKSSIGPRATSPNSNPSLGFAFPRISRFDRAGKKRGSDITEKRPVRFEAWRRTGVSWVRVVYFCAGRRVGAELCLSETCAETKSKQQTDKN